MNIDNKNILKLGLFTIIGLVIGVPIIFSGVVGIIKICLFIFSGINNKTLFFIDTNNYTFELKDMVNFSFVIAGVIITAIFSYLIWKANKTSADVSTKLSNLEEQRDYRIRKEYATILYYSALSGLELVYDLYRKKKILKSTYLSSDWTKNLAGLNDSFTALEIRDFYDLYSELLEIKKLAAIELNRNLYNRIEGFMKQICDESCLEYDALDPNDKLSSPLSLLCLRHLNLFVKLKRIFTEKGIETDSKNNVNKHLRGHFKDSKFISGERYEYYTNGITFCKIVYEDGVVIRKVIMNFEGNKTLESCSYDNDLPTGYKQIYDNKRLVFDGEIKEGKKHNGKGYYFKISDSEGFDCFREEAWIESKHNEANDEYYQEQDRLAYEANSEWWEEYCSVEYNNGESKLLLETAFKEYQY